MKISIVLLHVSRVQVVNLDYGKTNMLIDYEDITNGSDGVKAKRMWKQGKRFPMWHLR